jgi:hypothetical protein
MEECLEQQLQLTSQLHLLRPLGFPPDAAAAAAASDAASTSSTDQNCWGTVSCKPISDSSSRDQGSTQAAVDAAAAVESAAAQRSPVLPLMMLSAAEPGSGAAHMMPGQQQQQQQQDALTSARVAASTHQTVSLAAQHQEATGNISKLASLGKGRGATAAKHAAASAAVAAVPSAAAARAAAEEELVLLSCLAVQGVWSAVGQLWSLAVASPAASSSNRCAQAFWQA